MSAELIYKKALEQFAEAGNAEAKFALAVGESLQKPDLKQAIAAVCNCLKSANNQLGQALDYIGDSYESSAESSIEQARADITEALIVLANR